MADYEQAGVADAGATAEQDALANLDAEDVSRYRELLRAKTFDRDGLARAFALTPEQVEALEKPVEKGPSRASVSAELADIQALRKSDPRKYWSDPVQQREEALLEKRGRDRQTSAPGGQADEKSTNNSSALDARS